MSDVVELIGAAHIGVSQGIGIGTARDHIRVCQRCAEIDAVVAFAQVDGICTTDTGDDAVSAIPSVHQIIAASTGEGVTAARSDSGHVTAQAREVNDPRRSRTRVAGKIHNTNRTDQRVSTQDHGLIHIADRWVGHDLLHTGGASEAVGGGDVDGTRDVDAIRTRGDGVACVVDRIGHFIGSDQICLRCIEVSVVARAAVEHVHASAALEQVVALVTTKVIVAATTTDGVVAQTAVNVVDVVGCNDGVIARTTIDLEFVRAADEVITKDNPREIHRSA